MFEPCQKKSCLCCPQATEIQISLCISSVLQEPSVLTLCKTQGLSKPHGDSVGSDQTCQTCCKAGFLQQSPYDRQTYIQVSCPVQQRVLFLMQLECCKIERALYTQILRSYLQMYSHWDIRRMIFQYIFYVFNMSCIVVKSVE